MKNSFNSKSTLKTRNKEYDYFCIKTAAQKIKFNVDKLPYSLRVLFENLLRNEDGVAVKREDIEAFAAWVNNGGRSDHEIAFMPARVLMQDFTGVPAVVDLAAMRDAVSKLGGNPTKINPLIPVDLVIDHSVMVDKYATPKAAGENVAIEMERNIERYKFLKWGQQALSNFRVVPPGTGICHQVNLEYLAKVVWTADKEGKTIAYPDTLVGTDSHTTMVNGLAVLGWGVGGIEAEAAMLGQSVSMLIPEVIGFKMTGKLKEGVTATDLVLVVTEMLRKKGVVGKFVEFYGAGLDAITLADRATIANMAPEYGATCGFFPIDEEAMNYLRTSARDSETIELVEKYAKENGMWRSNSSEPLFTDVMELDLATVKPCVAGPKRPQDRIVLENVKPEFEKLCIESKVEQGSKDKLDNGSVVIAAITSCTNTSNPSVMIAAGLVAQKAAARGLKAKPWVKTSLAPGSKVVTEYLEKSGLQVELDKLGFNLVGYGCTTCIGNSGPLKDEFEAEIKDKNLLVASVLSGNRNFEGRVHPLVKANYLMSPPLVVAYAIAGNVLTNLETESLGKDSKGNDVYLRDIWPTSKEVETVIQQQINAKMFGEQYMDVFAGTQEWQKIGISGGMTYSWDKSTYINNPPYFEGMGMKANVRGAISNAGIIAIMGDSVTTDHISPAGNISATSPAAKYLESQGVKKADYNSYGSRRGNHEVMMRGTFANVRIRNEMAPGTEGGVTKYIPTDEVMSIYDAAMKYKEASTPLIVFAGKDYGMGSSRDWAAKGTYLLGIRAVIAESFERIHRSNLVGMGVLPLQFMPGTTRKTLNLVGDEIISIVGMDKGLTPKQRLKVQITRKDGKVDMVDVICRIDTENEIEYYNQGGILHKVIRDLAA